jgi:hypothetical protein
MTEPAVRKSDADKPSSYRPRSTTAEKIMIETNIMASEISTRALLPWFA